MTCRREVSTHAVARLCRCFSVHKSGAGVHPGPGLDLSSLDLEEIANALAGQTDYEHRWLINPQTGEIAF
jgi:hypothetical protein